MNSNNSREGFKIVSTDYEIKKKLKEPNNLT